MKFFENYSAESKESHIENTWKDETKDLAKELQRSDTRNKLSHVYSTLRLGFLVALFVGAEAIGQVKEKIAESVESAKRAVTVLDSTVRATPDRTGKMMFVNGKMTNFFEKNIGGKLVHSNDFYLYMREEKREGGRVTGTKYGVDMGKNGAVDKIVMVPGAVGKTENENIVAGFGSDKGSIKTEADLASIERDGGKDTPSLHRNVILPDGSHWIEISFEDGGVTDYGETATPQGWWEVKTGMAAAEAKEK